MSIIMRDGKNNMSIEIRAAKLDDAEAIAKVHVKTWRSTYPGIVPQPYLDSLKENEFAERWRDRIANDPAMSICIAEADQALCGFASGGRLRKPISFYDAELYAVYLLPAMQRTGRWAWSVCVDCW